MPSMVHGLSPLQTRLERSYCVRLLITGGAGFIGSNLVRRALSHEHEVVVVDDLSTGYRQNLDGLDVDFREASILDESAMAAAVQGVDSVVHLGAIGSVPRSIADPVSSHAANATGTLSVLEAARAADVSHVLCASSSSVYGMNPAMPKAEREWVRPMSPYAVTKLATEQYTLAYQQSYGFDSVAFRFFNVYGPRQAAGHAYAAVIPVFMDALMKGDPLPVNGDGTQSRDFTFVETVCSVLLTAAEQRTTNPEPVNLAFGTNTSLLQLIDLMQEVTGIEANVHHREPRPGDVQHSQANNDALRSLFPDIQPTPLREGIRKTYDWFKEIQ